MKEWSVRPFAAGDWAAAWALWERELPGSNDGSWDEAHTAAFIARNPGSCFAAFAGGALVGTVMAGHDGRRGYVYHLAVAEAWRRRGIGRTLLNAACAALAEKGIRKVHLFVFTANDQAKRFYERMGLDRRDDLTVWSQSSGKPTGRPC